MFKRLLATLLSLAATLAAAAPATLFPSRLITGGDVDTAALGTRVPLILVHGLGGTGEGWDNLLQAYARNPAWRAAFKPYTFRYSSDTTDVLADPTAPRTIPALGAAMRDRLQEFYDKPTPAPSYGFGRKSVVILAHSMGGLVARAMMQEQTFRDGTRGGEHVLHLVTLGTPHHGSPLADAGIALGMQASPELTRTFAGIVANQAWTNADGLDMSGGLCNPWLARLNNYAPSTGATYGRCGAVPANPLPGFYEKIVAYAARTLQQPDVWLGRTGVYKPGSSTALLAPYAYLHNGLSRSYANDGLVPYASAQFEGTPIGARAEAFDCDHRYMERGYPEFVRTSSATYNDWAFCAASTAGVVPSGAAGGSAIGNTIFGAPGGIVDTVQAASETERVFDWAEQAYAAYLQPPGTTTGTPTGITEGFYYRYYPATGAYIGAKAGAVYYKGPASGGQVIRIASMAEFLAQAQGAGF
ncbi:alpha/beta fold hydrolase [Ramlibacter sp.]|uniref:esterase/lipase family protein n=1 Tax=Ramlibacter sp. TaxID=1917967 RepID=UPI0017C406D0|nr:alpha/beta fold hydrolase [Ramlibacter sp.]MBA2674750.1 alpha/beta fold hydrolase [Ramlibacter sp.]